MTDLAHDGSIEQIYEKYARLPGLPCELSEWVARAIAHTAWGREFLKGASARSWWAWTNSNSIALPNPIMIELSDFIEKAIDVFELAATVAAAARDPSADMERLRGVALMLGEPLEEWIEARERKV
jgi:hypothetical protein